jgi:hypothetical protein
VYNDVLGEARRLEKQMKEEIKMFSDPKFDPKEL